MVMLRPKTSSLRRTKKNRFAVGAKVLVIMPGVTGVVTHVDDEPGMFGEYMHAIKTEHGERHEPGSNLDLIPKAVTNTESAPSAPAGSTHIHIENMENSAFIQGSPGASVNQTFDIHSQEFSNFVANLRELVAGVNLSEVQRSEANADFDTIDAQMKSPNPKTGIIRASLESVKAILENATGSLIGSAAYATLVYYLLHMKP
jgi:hypothetical protein